MHRSSESVAAIATALAKAQTELSNPEKSMVGTIYHSNRSDNPQTFRYAPLSSGLEIIRKTLGGQQIAIAQSTAIDQANKVVNLTTTLMHTSGEWISSDWPVCQLSEASAPRRMGAALTYARRYALFTLVGIAGEDDLDAPDLQSGTPNQQRDFAIHSAQNGSDLSPSQPSSGSTRAANLLFPRSAQRPDSATLSGEQSDARRDRLISTIETTACTEDLQAQAGEILKAKNQLSVADAKAVEEAFLIRMKALQGDEPDPEPPLAPARHADKQLKNAEPPSPCRGPAQMPIHNLPSVKASSPTDGREKRENQIRKEDAGGAKSIGKSDLSTSDSTTATANEECAVGSVAPDLAEITVQETIDKSLLKISKLKRHRDKAHLRYVASRPCLICGRSPSDAHHLRFAQPRAMACKTSDEFTVPLCRTHHRDNHRVGNEREWWSRLAIDPLAEARTHWKRSRAIE